MRSAALFCMAEIGHFRRMRSLIRALADRGIRPYVFTSVGFRSEVERAGGVFVDLFERRPLDAADAESIPVPSRFVTFAAVFADDICRHVASLSPSLVVHDTFAVIGRVVAHRLRLPRVNLCAGHNMAPVRFVQALARDPRVRLSTRCLDAVEVLRSRDGITDASPFSYVSGTSPDLNLYGEPPEFIDEESRAAFEPVAFWGSLPAAQDLDAPPEGPGWFASSGSEPLRVYASLGTIVWRYYAPRAYETLAALSRTFAADPGIDAVIGLGHARIGPDEAAALRAPNVRVEPYVDQWRMLHDADVFVTHQGMNSTHEAIFHRVPMISCPFFSDQPALSTLCTSLGLAAPLADAPGAPVTDANCRRALDRVIADRTRMVEALERVRRWELATVAGRAAVLSRIEALA